MSSGWLGSMAITVILANQNGDVGNMALFLFGDSAYRFNVNFVVFNAGWTQFIWQNYRQ